MRVEAEHTGARRLRGWRAPRAEREMHRRVESNTAATAGQAWAAYSYRRGLRISVEEIAADLLAGRDDPERATLIFPAGTDVLAIMDECGSCSAESTKRGRGFELRAYAWDDEPHGLGGVEVRRDGELEYDLPNGPPIKPDGVFVAAALLTLHLADRPPQAETAPPLRYEWRLDRYGDRVAVPGDGWMLHVFPPDAPWAGWHFDIDHGDQIVHMDEANHPGPRECQAAAEAHFAEHYECLAAHETAPHVDTSAAGDDTPVVAVAGGA